MTQHEQVIAVVSFISTHTLRKEGDEHPARAGAWRRLISTHTLRKEGDFTRPFWFT